MNKKGCSMKYLIKTTEQYRCDTEKEAVDLIKQAKQASEYNVVKYNSEIKTLKQKGEVVDEWRRVTITKEFSEEKEPYGNLMPYYSDKEISNVDEEDDLK